MFDIFANGNLIYQPLDDSLRLLGPRLVVEMGKAGSLEFSIPQSNSFYTQMNQLKTLISVEMDGRELFRGRVLTNERNFNNIRKIYSEGDLAYLIDSVQKAEKYNGKTHDLFRRIIAAHNERVDASKRFTVGVIGIENRDIILTGQSDQTEDPDTGDFDYNQIAINSVADEWQTTFDYIETCLIDTCGGYLRTRRENGVTYIDLVQDYWDTATQEIELGINMLDLTETISAEDLFTVLIPIGDENLTIESVNNGSDELIDASAVAQYGRIVRTHVFSGVNQASTLLENGQRYLASHVNVPTTFTVKAVDLHLIDPNIRSIYLGDRVHINSSAHGLVEYLVCTKIEYDLEDPSNTVYTFGNPKQSLTERYRKDKRKQSDTHSGGGGAAAAADARADDGLNDFFNAWINVDPDSAHIDLGTLYKDYERGKLVLQRDCGIDIDGVTGNINIKSLKSEFDELGNEVSKQGAQINLINDDLKARIELVASHVDIVDGIEQGHYAEFVLFANSTESAIQMKADKVTVESIQTELTATSKEITDTKDVLTKQCGINLDGTTGNVNISSLYTRVTEDEQAIQTNSANITAVSNNLGSRIDLVAQSVDTNSNNIASLQVTANNHTSQIKLKADTVTLNAKVTTINGRLDTNEADIETLKADYAKIDTLIANKISATFTQTYILRVGQGLFTQALKLQNEDVATQKWVRANFSSGSSSNYATKAWVEEQGYLTEVPKKLYSLEGLSVISSGTMYWGGQKIATQNWVTEQLVNYASATHSHAWASITGKPTRFTPAKHTHSFSGSTSLAWGHTHGTSSSFKAGNNTLGVNNYSGKTISISGTTGENS